MTHRQWKKNFKKKHHRNPFWFEDKRERRKSPAGDLLTTYSKFAAGLQIAIENAMPYLREGLDRFAMAATKAANEVTKSVTRAFDCIQFPEPVEISSRDAFLQARMYYGEPLMENAIIRIAEPKNTTEESDEIHTQ